ncbi:hypothetical protein KJ978_00265 [Patescibacteria group bacterium]|nr:hypothetical protein [Patescibacteria group bacterium]MBU1420907.1 hypothetical protein [Patescibacteria group bacterium]MBU2415916.1 hypothetical protein [Patescibacteria group bacterium]MBU2456838.1 hypothetical protein [Patescibacteria group bacterium]
MPTKILKGVDPAVLARDLKGHAKALEGMHNWHGPQKAHIIEDFKITAELARHIKQQRQRLDEEIAELKRRIQDLQDLQKSDVMPPLYK